MYSKSPHLLFLLFLLLVACKTKEQSIHSGLWQGQLELREGVMMPFLFELEHGQETLGINLRNAEERLPIDEISFKKQKLTVPMHIFDTEISAEVGADEMSGHWTKRYEEDYFVPFVARPIEESDLEVTTSKAFNGKWRIKFETEEVDSIFAVGVFEDYGSRTKGTIMTVTGDYRYLEGTAKDSTMKLSTFDGEHAFLFDVSYTGPDTIKGMFYSGNHYLESWWAVRDEDARLPDALKMTFLNEGYEEVSFAFPDLNGDTLTFPNKEYDGKVVLLQIFGTWCPNCMDESKFYSAWYDANKDRGVEIIALAYERKADFEYASGRVSRMKEKIGAGYQFVIAGIDDKVAAGKSLPMLNHVLSFPTTIFIDREGNIRRIHTGFTGPGTGHYYDEFVADFNEKMDELLEESEG